ncbi:DUF134 domain-containing protein [Romboutsia sp.]|uniref:DUF134 domain-containing protein n=1 Tax=Romboutsia sp. TaxID=1965302 RepID=UPI002C531AA6|nr:DUF134 domain-containing protein [Romboutsia sp.]HSQ88370.1 DUF134 domain-containing protein [Romboutsia sp.]
MDLKCFIPQQTKDEKIEEVEITSKEMQAIKLIDVYGLKDKKCAKKMKISMHEFEELITNARKKIATALIEGKTIKIIDLKPIENKITTLCKFRCAVCGEIYTINYTQSKISCPLCFSSNIMTNEEAGFCK